MYINLKKFFIGIFLILFFISCHSFTKINRIIKVACVGDSITFGATILNRGQNSYPAQLGRLLGEGWEVKNFGVSSATLLKNGNVSYWKQNAFGNAKDFNPDIVIILMGTNDTKPQNWKFKNEFMADYTALINEFKVLPSKPYIFICLPVPVYDERWGLVIVL